VDGTPWWFELKHKKGVSVLAALRQAQRDTDKRPVVVVWRESGERTIYASLDVNTFVRNFTKVEVALGREPKALGGLDELLVHLALDDFLRLLKGGWVWR